MTTSTVIGVRMLAMALLATGVLLGSAPVTEAALTTPACLAKKLKEWGNLRKCQAIENGKVMQGKPADLGKCQTKFDEKLAKLNTLATAAAIACRFGVNTGAEAGTATDYDTGLQWERKTDDGSVHDKDNSYSWSDGGGGYTQPDGTAFKVLLGTLNNGSSSDGAATSGCFAGHCDWRLPTIEELVGIVDTTQGVCSGGSGPCIDQTVFGPTIQDAYESATTNANAPGNVWGVDFDGGYVDTFGKSNGRFWTTRSAF